MTDPGLAPGPDPALEERVRAALGARAGMVAVTPAPWADVVDRAVRAQASQGPAPVPPPLAAAVTAALATRAAGVAVSPRPFGEATAGPSPAPTPAPAVPSRSPLPPGNPPPVAAPPPVGPTGRSPWVWVAVALAVVLVGATAAYALLADDGSDPPTPEQTSAPQRSTTLPATTSTTPASTTTSTTSTTPPPDPDRGSGRAETVTVALGPEGTVAVDGRVVGSFLEDPVTVPLAGAEVVRFGDEGVEPGVLVELVVVDGEGTRLELPPDLGDALLDVAPLVAAGAEAELVVRFEPREPTPALAVGGCVLLERLGVEVCLG